MPLSGTFIATKLADAADAAKDFEWLRIKADSPHFTVLQ
jgi:hypothetical protein